MKVLNLLEALRVSFLIKFYLKWYRYFTYFFLILVIVHLIEHFVQIYQLYILNWNRQQSLGIIGLLYPWLIKSELLHFSFALITLLGLLILQKTMFGLKAKKYWNLAILLACFHLFEHLLLILQVMFNYNFYDSPIPISFGQLFLPRIELHFFYNLIIFIPMLLALIYKNRIPNLRVRIYKKN